MGQEGLSRKVYPSDLTDEQWAIVEPMIPPAKQNPRGGRPREVDMREVLNTIFGDVSQVLIPDQRGRPNS